jgi:uncharacterized protein (DUF58 family)
VTAYGAAPLSGRWALRPTGRGIATAVLGVALLVAGTAWRYPGVIGMGAALLGAAVLAVASMLGGAPVSVHRTVSPLEVSRFQPCQATLRARRSGGLVAAGIEALDHVAGRPVPVLLPRLGRGGTAAVDYQIPTDRRGVLDIGPLDLHRRALAGLAGRRAVLGGTVRVRVLPRVLPVRGMPYGVRRGHSGVDERVPYGGTDLVGLREYAPGDDLRRLHWATSARTGTLMVREDADPSIAQLTLLVDDRVASYPDGDLEDAIEVAASLAVAAAENEHGVRLLTVCGQLDITELATPGLPAGVAARSLVSALAEVVELDADTEPAPLPVAALDVVVVLTGARAELAALLAEAGRAAVGVLAIVDPGDHPAPAAQDDVTVLRGADSTEILRLWDAAVVPV